MLLVLACVALPAATRASEQESKERTAKTACLSGDYAKGVALLAELYVSTNEVMFLFNQGRCFEQNGRYQEAIVRFREYQQKNADAGNAPDDDAEKHIAKCRALMAKDNLGMVDPTIAPPAVAQKVSRAVAPAMPEVATEPKAGMTQASGPESSGRGLRLAGATVAGLGVAGLVTGVILNLKANNLAKGLEAANTSPTPVYSRSKESSRSTYQTLGWVAYGAGAACMAGGALLYYLGYSQGQGAQVALVPTVSAGNVGAVFQGAF